MMIKMQKVIKRAHCKRFTLVSYVSQTKQVLFSTQPASKNPVDSPADAHLALPSPKKYTLPIR